MAQRVGVRKEINMAWIKYIEGQQEPEPDKDVLVVIERKRLGEEVVRERHVGHRGGKDGKLWIIGNQFGFDMGEVLYYQYMEEIPED